MINTFLYNEGAVALANIFCWAAALLYAQMGGEIGYDFAPIPYKHSSFPDIPFGMPEFRKVHFLHKGTYQTNWIIRWNRNL